MFGVARAVRLLIDSTCDSAYCVSCGDSLGTAGDIGPMMLLAAMPGFCHVCFAKERSTYLVIEPDERQRLQAITDRLRQILPSILAEMKDTSKEAFESLGYPPKTALDVAWSCSEYLYAAGHDDQKVRQRAQSYFDRILAQMVSPCLSILTEEERKLVERAQMPCVEEITLRNTFKLPRLPSKHELLRRLFGAPRSRIGQGPFYRLITPAPGRW
jgi:hypothetical protein